MNRNVVHATGGRAVRYPLTRLAFARQKAVGEACGFPYRLITNCLSLPLQAYGRGKGVPRGRGVGVVRNGAVAVAVGVAVAVAVGVGLPPQVVGT